MRSLEDMDLIFSQASSPFDVVRVAKTLPTSETLDVEVVDGGMKDDEIMKTEQIA